ncbi:hypothetical protein [Mesorhizobium sp. IMUNJ 23232]|uniref:hypothetical protein n=1 Tax=Mesorhizobium sp. IMUNJ 23232 TaxID=3376064 RepID=UPI0037941B47
MKDASAERFSSSKSGAGSFTRRWAARIVAFGQSLGVHCAVGRLETAEEWCLACETGWKKNRNSA